MAKKSKSKKNLKLRIIIFSVLSVVLCLSFIFNAKIENYLNALANPKINSNIALCELKVHYIDVGQGDSILIELPDNKLMLIDSGDNSEETKLSTYLSNFFSSRQNLNIDYFIVTHQDADHIGGSDIVFENYNVLNFFRPNVYTTAEAEEKGLSLSSNNICDTATFKKMIELMNSEGCNEFLNMAYDSMPALDDNCGYTIKFLAPISESYTAANDYSPIIKLTYMSRSFLFTGDATTLSEKEALNSVNVEDLDCDILKVGHHGSDTSTSLEFLNKVSPIYAVISVGKNNKYKHPSDIVITRLVESIGQNNVYRTDENGNIDFGIDKDELTNGKGTIFIAVNQSTTFVIEIHWWYIVVSIEALMFIVIFLPKSKALKAIKLTKKTVKK